MAEPTGNGSPQAQVLRIVGETIRLVERRGYLPGERILSEREIAERFEVGRAVVREAMAMLEAMRYLERRRGSGVFLSGSPDSTSLEALVITSEAGLPLGEKTNADSVEVRRIVEVQAIRIACLRRDDESLARIRDVLDGFDFAVTDNLTASDYDVRFHLEVMRSTGNDILPRLMHPFFAMSRRRREAFFADEAQRVTSHRQHLDLYAAIENRDPDTAEKLMNRHIGRVDAWFSEHATG